MKWKRYLLMISLLCMMFSLAGCFFFREHSRCGTKEENNKSGVLPVLSLSPAEINYKISKHSGSTWTASENELIILLKNEMNIESLISPFPRECYKNTDSSEISSFIIFPETYEIPDSLSCFSCNIDNGLVSCFTYVFARKFPGITLPSELISRLSKSSIAEALTELEKAKLLRFIASGHNAAPAPSQSGKEGRSSASMPGSTQPQNSNSIPESGNISENFISGPVVFRLIKGAGQIKSALMRGPVIATLEIYEDFFYYASGVYSHICGNLYGAKSVLITGWDDRKKAWKIRNTWGNGWGENGTAWIAYGQCRIEELFVITFDSPTQDLNLLDQNCIHTDNQDRVNNLENIQSNIQITPYNITSSIKKARILYTFPAPGSRVPYDSFLEIIMDNIVNKCGTGEILIVEISETNEKTAAVIKPENERITVADNVVFISISGLLKPDRKYRVVLEGALFGFDKIETSGSDCWEFQTYCWDGPTVVSKIQQYDINAPEPGTRIEIKFDRQIVKGPYGWIKIMRIKNNSLEEVECIHISSTSLKVTEKNCLEIEFEKELEEGLYTLQIDRNCILDLSGKSFHSSEACRELLSFEKKKLPSVFQMNENIQFTSEKKSEEVNIYKTNNWQPGEIAWYQNEPVNGQYSFSSVSCKEQEPGRLMIVTSFPEPGATLVPLNCVLEAKFSGEPPKGAGKYVYILRLPDFSVFEKHSLKSKRVVTEGNSLKIYPDKPLEPDTSYLVDINNRPEHDHGNPDYGGWLLNTPWYFSTGTSLPLLLLDRWPFRKDPFLPNTGPLILLFNKPVYPGPGFVRILSQASHTDERLIKTDSPSISIREREVSIFFSPPLKEGENYQIKIDCDAFLDGDGRNFIECKPEKDWYVTAFDALPPVPVLLNPEPGSVDVPVLPVLTIIFDEEIKPGAGAIKIQSLEDPSDFQSVDISSPLLSLSGKIASVSLSKRLRSRTLYCVELPAGIFLDSYNNPFPGLPPEYEWIFRTEDIDPPAIVKKFPETGSMVPAPTFISIEFNERVKPGTGYLTLLDFSSGAVLKKFTPQSCGVNFQENLIVFDISNIIPEKSTVTIILEPGFALDSGGNPSPGITGPSDWYFSVPDRTAPRFLSFYPPSRAKFIPLNTTLEIEANEDLKAGSGILMVKKLLSGEIYDTVDASSSRLSIQGNTVRIKLNKLKSLEEYFIEVPSGFLTDMAGNPSPAITGPSSWTFLAGEENAILFSAWSYEAPSPYQIWIINPDGSGARQLLSLPSNCFHPCWSPDRTHFVFDTYHPNGVRGVALSTLDGSKVTMLTPDNINCHTPSWSPDGTRIAFVSGNSDIYTMKPDGSEKRNITNAPHLNASYPAWSPDSRTLVFSSENQSEPGLYLVSAGGGTPRLLLRGERLRYPCWSPDGSKIVFSSSPALEVINSDGTGRRSLGVNGTSPTWAGNGLFIAYEFLGELYTIPSNGGTAFSVTSPLLRVYSPSWSSF